MNVVAVAGRMVADPELRYTTTGVPVVSFRVAVRKVGKKEEGGDDADFFNVVAWRKTAEFVGNYFVKGGMIGVSGYLQTRTYETDGVKKYVTEIVADRVFFVGPKGDQNGG